MARGGWDLQAQDAMGTLNLQKLLDLKEQGIDVESLLSLDKRTDLYAKEVRSLAPFASFFSPSFSLTGDVGLQPRL